MSATLDQPHPTYHTIQRLPCHSLSSITGKKGCHVSHITSFYTSLQRALLCNALSQVLCTGVSVAITLYQAQQTLTVKPRMPRAEMVLMGPALMQLTRMLCSPCSCGTVSAAAWHPPGHHSPSQPPSTWHTLPAKLLQDP